MFSNRQRHAAAGAGAAVSDDASAREEAAALAEEIAARSDGKGKGERSPGVQRFWMLVTAGLVFLVVFFAPMSWNSTQGGGPAGKEHVAKQQLPVVSAPNPMQQQVDRTVADCTRRLSICQQQSAKNCADSVIAACSRLMQLCASVHGGGGVALQQKQQQQQDLPPRVNSLSEVQSVRQSGFQQQQQQLRQQPQWQAEDERPRLSPKLEPDSASEASPMQRDPDSPRWNEPMPHTSRDSPTGRRCVCPALSPGPICPQGEVGQGTCACPTSKTTPFEHKDHVSKLVKRELPQTFTGPVVLARDSPSIKGLIRVHLPGKEPAWKRIGKISKGEAEKWLPLADPVRGGNKLYETCAVVGSSGVLLLQDKGAEIDSHDFVMRFNGAPTKGLERFVGSKTTVRIVNHSWQDFRETSGEIILSHLRGPHHLEDFKLRRQANGAKENWFLFSPEFSNYAAQTAYEVATYFNINLQAEGDQAWTPTGGWTGIVMAMNICSKVDIYGFHISERHGVPYHYHNRCPQPFMHRDVAEWLMVQSFKKHGLIEFRDPCVFECHATDEECRACKAQHPVPRSVYEAGKAIWKKGPMPEYCSARLDWLKKEEKAGRCQGLCGTFEKQSDWGKA